MGSEAPTITEDVLVEAFRRWVEIAHDTGAITPADDETPGERVEKISALNTIMSIDATAFNAWMQIIAPVLAQGVDLATEDVLVPLAVGVHVGIIAERLAAEPHTGPG